MRHLGRSKHTLLSGVDRPDSLSRVTFFFFPAKTPFFFFIFLLFFGNENENEKVVLTRVGQGVGDAACSPFAVSILRDHFGPEVIGSAIGVVYAYVYVVSIAHIGAVALCARVRACVSASLVYGGGGGGGEGMSCWTTCRMVIKSRPECSVHLMCLIQQRWCWGMIGYFVGVLYARDKLMGS